MTKTVPILVFETDQSNLEIIYDYDHIPNDKDKFVGKIIHEFLQVAGGGFLDSVQDYTNLENNISNILNQHETFLTKQANEKNTEKTVAKKQVKTKNNKENSKPQQVTAKTAKKKTNKEKAK